MIRLAKAPNNVHGAGNWAKDPKKIERARIVSVVCLSKRPRGELVRIIMDWLHDADLYKFCHKYLYDDELALIQGEAQRPNQVAHTKNSC